MKFIIHNDTIITSTNLKPTKYLFNSTFSHKLLHANFKPGLIYKILKTPRKVFLLKDEKENLLKLFVAICELKKHKVNKKKAIIYSSTVQYLKKNKYTDKKASLISSVLVQDEAALIRVKRDDPLGYAYFQKLLHKNSYLLDQLAEAQNYFRVYGEKSCDEQSNSRYKFKRLGNKNHRLNEISRFHNQFCMYQEAAVDYTYLQNEYTRMLEYMEKDICDVIINIPEAFYPEVKLWNLYVKKEKIVLSKTLKKQFITKNQTEIYKYIQGKLKQDFNINK